MIRQVRIYDDYPENGGKLKKIITTETLTKRWGKIYETGKNFVGANESTERKAPEYIGVELEERK